MTAFEVGSYVKFGHFPQHGKNPEPIEWQVLDSDGKTALAVAKLALDCQPFHHEFAYISWRDCDLRHWLNGEFLSSAFCAEEQERIAESLVNTGDNPQYGTSGCGETIDKVFCLSADEAVKHFASGDTRRCEPTPYAVGRNVYRDIYKVGDDTKEFCCFWLRTPGFSTRHAARVCGRGTIGYYGCNVDGTTFAVRPALRIKL